jgi:hypothetical protein
VISSLAANGLDQIFGLQNTSRKTSPVWRYSNGGWGSGFPPAFAAVAFRLFIKAAIALCSSLAAVGLKVKTTEPSDKFSVMGEEDILYFVVNRIA